MHHMDKLDFRILKVDQVKEVTDFMVNHFVAFEPISNTIPITLDEGRRLFGPYIKNALWQNVSIGVYDMKTNELVAIRINLLGKNQHLVPPLEYNMDEQTLPIRQFNEIIVYLFGEDLSVTVGTKDYMELFLVAVKQDCGNRGITTELYRRSEILAKQHDCTVMPVICTNAYTLKATMKLGYEVLKQIPYADYIDPITGEKILKGMKEPHILLSVLVKQVSKCTSNWQPGHNL